MSAYNHDESQKKLCCLSFVTIFSPILIVFGRCLELHELGDVVKEGEDHYDTDVAPALTHAALKLHLQLFQISPENSSRITSLLVCFTFYIFGQTKSNNLISFPDLARTPNGWR